MHSKVSHVVVTSAAVLWLAGYAAPAAAQTAFLDAVQELARTATTSTVNPDDLLGRRTATLTRMKAALAQWDRSIAMLEDRVAGELRTANDERTFQLRVEIGLAYRQRGRLADALREFDAAAAALPDASDIHVLRALTLDAAANTVDAGRAFRTAWLRDTANPLKAYLAVTRGRDLTAAERERARRTVRAAFDRALAKDAPARGAAFLVLDPVPDNLASAPVVADAVMADVFARLAEGKLDDALASVPSSTATGRTGDSPLAHFERGRAAEIEGRQADARQSYTAALAGTLTGRHVLYVGIGRLAQVEGEAAAAIEAFEHAVRLHPNDPLIHRELAGAYAGTGRIDEAFDELVAALLIDPGDGEALAAVGQLFLDHDRAAEAVAVLNRAIEMDPERAEAHYALAVALSRAGRDEEAARQFERFDRMSAQALEHRRREVTGQAAPGGAGR